HIHELLNLAMLVFRVTAQHGLLHALADLLAQQLLLDALEGRAHGGDLGDDVDAVATLLDHAREAAHLPLDAAQAVEAATLGLAVHARPIPPWGIVRRANLYQQPGSSPQQPRCYLVAKRRLGVGHAADGSAAISVTSFFRTASVNVS